MFRLLLVSFLVVANSAFGKCDQEFSILESKREALETAERIRLATAVATCVSLGSLAPSMAAAQLVVLQVKHELRQAEARYQHCMAQ